MACNRRPVPTDEELYAALDTDMPVDLQEHNARCSDCTERWEQMHREDVVLGNTLRRWDCPSANTLGSYYLSLLSPAAQRTVSTHLEECRRCRDELSTLRTFMPPEPEENPAPSLPSLALELPWPTRIFPPIM